MSENRQNFKILKEAYRSFRKKQYVNTAVILEQTVRSSPDDPYPYFLLAVTKLYSADFSGANSVMQKLERVNPSYIPFLQLNAFLGLKSARNREEAISVYLNAIEKAPSDKVLLRGLRQCEDLNNFPEFQKNSRISDLVVIKAPGRISVPVISFDHTGKSRGKRRNGKGLTAAVSIVVIASAIAAGVYLGSMYVPSGFIGNRTGAVNSSDAEKIDRVDITGSGYGLFDRLNRQPVKEFYTSADVMISQFNEARQLMKNGEMNRAAVILNRIINSNASQVVKEKCGFLISFIIDSDDRTYEKPDIKAIQEKPYLYRGVALDLEGRAANVKRFEKGTGFTLMVDYDGRNFRWIAQVFTPGGNAVENGQNVRVQGVYISGIGADNRAYISSARVDVVK